MRNGEKEEAKMAREWDPAEEGIKAARRDNAARKRSVQIVGRLIDYRGKRAKVVGGAYGFIDGPTAYWVRLLEECGKYGASGDEVIVSRRTIVAKLCLTH